MRAGSGRVRVASRTCTGLAPMRLDRAAHPTTGNTASTVPLARGPAILACTRCANRTRPATSLRTASRTSARGRPCRWASDQACDQWPQHRCQRRALRGERCRAVARSPPSRAAAEIAASTARAGALGVLRRRLGRHHRVGAGPEFGDHAVDCVGHRPRRMQLSWSCGGPPQRTDGAAADGDGDGNTDAADQQQTEQAAMPTSTSGPGPASGRRTPS